MKPEGSGWPEHTGATGHGKDHGLFPRGAESRWRVWSRALLRVLCEDPLQAGEKKMQGAQRGGRYSDLAFSVASTHSRKLPGSASLDQLLPGIGCPHHTSYYETP